MSFIQRLEVSVAKKQNRWKGTFREFLELFEQKKFPNMGVLSHQRLYNMIVSSGTEKQDYFGSERISYKFFEDQLFGIEECIDAVMSYIHSAAQRTETSRRMLLLFGPPSSGKSRMVQLIKRGLEQYTRKDEGTIFAIEGSKMHENPFVLMPEDLRSDFEKEYGLRIEGYLNPISRHRLMEEFDGDCMKFPIEQIFISEADRVGIGTYLPSDPKSSDQSELVGGLDFARIQEFGDESDPRVYNFSGELNVANRGIMEFIEGLRADERFLRVLLIATEEKAIKAPRFGLIYTDTMIIIHCNESEFQSFMSDKKNEAYHDRMVMVRAPYNLSVSNEVKIYERLLEQSDVLRTTHIAPKTLNAAAMFAILSRLESPPDGGDLTLLKKMKLYDKQHVKGYKFQQVPTMKQKAPREGMFGISPRFIIDQIAASITKARDEGRNFITALDVFRQINKGILGRDAFTKEEKTKFEDFMDQARQEWNDFLRNDIQKAFFVSFEEDARNLCENYLDQIDASCSGEKLRDPITDEEIEIDEKLMDSIEGQIDVTSSGKEDFRNEILRAVASATRKSKKFSYTQHAHLRDAIHKQLFQERQGVIRMTVTSRNPDTDELERINAVVERMGKQGYSAAASNELLKYATAHLFEK